MARPLTLNLIAFLALFLGSCAQEVHWESLPQIKSVATRALDRAWLVTVKGDLLRTEDGGKTWRTTAAQTIGDFQSAAMLDDRNGLAVNNKGQVWSTIDGGQTWAAKAELKTADWHFNESDQIQFMDELHGWIVETLTIWRTEDGGRSWKKVFSPFEQKAEGQPVRAFFLDLRQAWVCGTYGEVYSTNDGGETWVIQTVSAKESDFTDVFFSDEKTGWLIGYIGGQPGNLLYRTNDGGKTWRLVPIAVNQGHLESVYFLNDKEGWLSGAVESDDAKAEAGRAILVRTVDGGKTWERVFAKDDEPFFSRVMFVDEQHGWLFGRDNVYQTQDGGQSWHTVLKLPPIKDAR